jgi:TIR domain
MMAQQDLDATLYQTLQQDYVALLGQRDSGIRTVVQQLSGNNDRLSHLRFLPLSLPLGLDDVDEFKQIVIDRLTAASENMLGDATISQQQADVLSRYANRGVDTRLRGVLNVLGQATQAYRIVVILQTLNKVATAPLTSLLLLLREYHDLITMPGEAGYRLRFLVAGDEQLWQLCRYKDSIITSPFNIAKIMFVDGMQLDEIRARVVAATDDIVRDIASFTGGVPLLVEWYERFSQEQLDPRNATLYFPYIQSTWNGLLTKTQQLLVDVMAGKSTFPPVIPDHESSAIPNLNDSWSDAFWGGFLRLHGGVLAWRSPIHKAFVQRMATHAAYEVLAQAPLEQRITHLQQALSDPGTLEARRQEGIALARETENDELANLLVSLQDHAAAGEISAQVQQLAFDAHSVWNRIYCRVMTQSAADIEWLLLNGIVLNAKRSTRDFDVFLCHNVQDTTPVVAMAEQLLQKGILPWLDVWEASPGKRWQMIISEDLERCKSTAVFIGQSGIGPWQDMEIQTVLDHSTHRKHPIIPVFLPGAAQVTKIPPFLGNFTAIDLEKSGNDGLQQIIDAIQQK